MEEKRPESGNEPVHIERKFEKKDFEKEIGAFAELTGKLHELEGMDPDGENALISLAFLVERKKGQNPEAWDKDLAALQEDVVKTYGEKGAAAASWILSEAVYAENVANLNEQMEKAGEEEKARLAVLTRMIEKHHVLKSELHAEGKKVTYGGVSMDCMPDWYRFVRE